MVPNIAASESPVIPMKAVHTSTSSTFLLIPTHYLLPLLLLVVLMLSCLVVCVGVGRLLARQKRSYLTQETGQGLGATIRTGETRREWVL